ncbi:hypothetical protein EC973_007076 [Apophysomyces ossiformis]|uniref:Major facilitator superfamily (MFS) profile domain-containing protein n=1 Tax=Apophysomyces ossiformis TaxID=679940 RepID=A0A8H7ETF3_9FUNG|nr:hypothetical protein EC973_007076 [Apophysomyces ossiformis]
MITKHTEEQLSEKVYIDEEKVYVGYEKDKENTVATSDAERAFLRKIDIMILPIVCAINFMQFLDKTTINYAAMFTFQQDLNLQGNDYNVIGSIFYLGYLLFQIPNNYLLQRIPIGRYIGIIVFVWGAVLFCSGFVHNFSQMTALRFCLGFFEGGIYPAVSLLVSTFYRRKEQAARMGYVWLCNGFAVAVGGLISYGIGVMDDHGIARWRWIMFIMGGVTCFIGIVAFLFLIGDPKSKLLHLTPEQEVLVDSRTRDNAVFRTHIIKKEHMIEACKEVRLWAFCLAGFLFCIRNGGMTIYNSQITHSFGFTKLQSILLMIPTGALDIIFILLSVHIATRLNQTLYVASAMMAFGSFGTLLMVVIPVSKVKLLGQYLGLASVSAYVLMMASISNNVSGYTKKIFYNGMMMMFYTIGNFIGPYVMDRRWSPHFVPSLVIYVCAMAVASIAILVARRQMAVVNEIRKANPSNTVTNVEDDLTDSQDPNFIYRL